MSSKKLYLYLESKDKSIIILRNALLMIALLAQKTKINPVKLEKDFSRIFKLSPSDSTEWKFLEMTLV